MQTAQKTKITNSISRRSFDGACACVDDKNKTDWSPPAYIKKHVELIASKCKADIGSVEFFFDAQNNPVYFDVNMLSSLP